MQRRWFTWLVLQARTEDGICAKSILLCVRDVIAALGQAMTPVTPVEVGRSCTGWWMHT